VFRARTHDLARHARQRLIEELDGQPLTPDDIGWYGTMTTIRLPWITDRSPHPGVPHPLQQRLADQKIEVPIVEWGDDVHVRVSCHLYNTIEHVDRLIGALKAARR
jgi:isopenicillin-N epimerase